MKKEKSCGAVIYRIINNEFFYLIQYMSLGHISLPKGHVEDNESEEETALREIKEETSLNVIIDNGFREVITYSPYPNIIKDVVFFIAENKENKKPIDTHDDEVNEMKFLSLNEALKVLTHDSDKNVLIKADNYLKEKEN